MAAADIASEPFLEDPVEHAARDRRAARRLAIAMGLATLLHLLVVAVTVIAPDWWRRAEPPKAIPITLVAEPPPPPPPPPPAEKPAPPSPEPPPMPYRRSGPDDKMASAPTKEPPPPTPSPAPPASEPAPETAPEPTPATPKPAEPLPTAPPPVPEAHEPIAKPIPPAKPATPKATPKPKPGVTANGAPPGEREMTGDLYFNLIRDKVKRNLRYPEPFRRDGLTGWVEFEVTVARSGEIVDLEKTRSSGISAIDLYAEEVIRRASPVPPVPPDLRGDLFHIHIGIPVVPPR